jgi:hypothetical protein
MCCEAVSCGRRKKVVTVPIQSDRYLIVLVSYFSLRKIEFHFLPSMCAFVTLNTDLMKIYVEL